MTAAGDLLTVKEAAPIVRLNPFTLYKKLGAGEIEAVRIGRKVLIRRSAIDAYLDRCTVPASTSATAAASQPQPTRTAPVVRQQRPTRNPNRTYRT